MKFIYLPLIILSLSTSVFASSQCKIQIAKDKSKIEGTGFKFSKKIKKGVTGVFKKFRLNKDSASSIDKLLTDLEVTVSLSSIDSGNKARDLNLRNSLFSGLTNNGRAVVKVVKVGGDNLLAKMSLNGVEKEIRFDLKKTEDEIIASGRFDALDYAMKAPFEALKRLCGPLHIGKDGVSKTWSDFAIKVTAAIEKINCK